jgi:hypothetical protein
LGVNSPLRVGRPSSFSTEALLSTPGWIELASCGSMTAPLCALTDAQPVSVMAAAKPIETLIRAIYILELLLERPRA